MNCDDAIWRKPETHQIATLPNRLWITHVIFYALHPGLSSAGDQLAEVQQWIPVSPELSITPQTLMATVPQALPAFFNISLRGGVARHEASEVDVGTSGGVARHEATGTQEAKLPPIIARSLRPVNEQNMEKFGRSTHEYYQPKPYYDMFVGGRKPRVRLCMLLLAKFPNLQEYISHVAGYRDGKPDYGLPPGVRQDIIVDNDDELAYVGQCVLECDYNRGKDALRKMHKEFIGGERPKVLWNDKDVPSFQKMHMMGKATDQFGPLIRLGKAFSGLTEENLLKMQKEYHQQERKRFEEEVADGRNVRLRRKKHCLYEAIHQVREQP